MRVFIKHLNGNISLNVSKDISNSELINLIKTEIDYPFELMFGCEYLSENSNINLSKIISELEINLNDIILIAINKRTEKKIKIENEEYSTYIIPMNHRDQISKIFSYKIIGSKEGTVWGGKNKIYTDDSNISKAAVFEGLVKLGEKAIVNIKMIDKKNSYNGDCINDIETEDWGYWDGSYIFIKN